MTHFPMCASFEFLGSIIQFKEDNEAFQVKIINNFWGQVLILEFFMFGELMNWRNLGISGQKIYQKVSFLNWFLS